MGTSLETLRHPLAANIEQVFIGGDLSRLEIGQRLELYKAVCASLGLNPLTKPFAYIQLNGKLTLYALKDCTDQLRTIHGISIIFTSRELIEGVYVVTARATRIDGRQDESTGCVPIDGLKGEARSNAMMKAETKAKRRVTLSICGLGMLDESEVDSVRGAKRVDQNYFPETRAAAERRWDADVKKAKLTMADKKALAHALEPKQIAGPEANSGEEATGNATQGGETGTAAESPGDIALPSVGSQQVPPELTELVKGILEGRKGYTRQGLETMRRAMEEVDPEMGAAMYRNLVEKHHLREGKPLPELVVRAMLEMWNAVELAKQVRTEQPPYQATDEDLPEGL